jgi:hypothetical protein
MNQEFRKTYADASRQQTKVKVLENLIAKAPEENAVVLAYKACVQALKGNYAFLPAMKLAYFWEANAYFEKALTLEPDNLEIIFLRFTVECGVPLLMSYALHLQEDRKKIISLLPKSNLDEEFKQAIIEYLLDSGKCSFEEKKILNSLKK